MTSVERVLKYVAHIRAHARGLAQAEGASEAVCGTKAEADRQKRIRHEIAQALDSVRRDFETWKPPRA